MGLKNIALAMSFRKNVSKTTTVSDTKAITILVRKRAANSLGSSQLNLDLPFRLGGAVKPGGKKMTR